MKNAGKFFAYARERHRIWLARQAGQPEPWTKDPVLRKYPFCCVFREHDRTTAWFREHVRDRYRERPEVLLATVVFRMFNRIATGEAIFSQTLLPSSRFKKNETTAFDAFAATGDPGILRHVIRAACGDGPYVTGAYIISTPPGYTKLEGVLEVLAKFWSERRPFGLGSIQTDFGWRSTAKLTSENVGLATLEEVWNWLSRFDYLGKFHSYEIVTDLRHTPLLDRAPDIMTWASPGPGARRGLNRVWGRNFRDKSRSREQMIEDMRELLSLSRETRMWPGEAIQTARGRAHYSREDWPAWEMREVEHGLCEFDKFERLRLGQGKSKRRFR